MKKLKIFLTLSLVVFLLSPSITTYAKKNLNKNDENIVYVKNMDNQSYYSNGC